MTGREMNIEFERAIGEIDPSLKIAEKLNTNTVFYFINLAQDSFIKQLFAESADNKSDEWAQIRLDYLKALVERYVLFNPGTDTTIIGGNYTVYPNPAAFPVGTTMTYDNGINIALPSNYMFYLKSDSKISSAHSGQNLIKWVQNKDIVHDDIQFLLNTPFNRPIFRNAFAVVEKSNLTVYKDYYTNLYNIQITYVRQPATISLTTNCELSAACHKNIVNMAVEKYIEEYRYKLQKASNTKK